MRFTHYRVADPGYRASLNRLCGRVIGTAVVLGSQCYSWVWKSRASIAKRSANDRAFESITRR
jgi:hypothetical protein